MHANNIQVGIVISNKGFLDASAIDSNFITSPFYWESPILPWDTTCSNQRLSSGGLVSNLGIPENGQLNPTCYGKPEDCYPTFEKSEMLKQIMRVFQYSMWVRDSTDHQAYKNKVTSNSIPPDSSIYLFDYMSLEYEYWDSTTFSKTAPSAGMSYRKAAWNNLYQYSGLMLYVYSQMCNYMKMELELRIVPPITDPLSSNYPLGPGDTAALEMPVVSMQVEYLARAFNRILVSDYKDRVGGTNIISKTGATHTKFSAHLNDLNPDERHKFMPVFSAATKDDYKHCFGDTLFNTSSPYNPLQWADTYFGPILSGSDTSRNYMHFFEQLYLHVLDSAIAANYQAPNCKEFYSASNATSNCPIDTTNQDIVGFMWYNYSMLSDSNRTDVNFNRLKSNVLKENYNLIQYNSSNYMIQTFVNEEIIGRSDLQILNMQGSLIFSYPINSTAQSFTLNLIPSGIYLCRISQGNSEPLKISVIK
ncbi:MAG: T9SS type A sorting domain-containing protein [Bacteroidetes bacterium]|nr:T9SS type A sorting domain-containing protein [Bacteroidota bacterium]MBP6413879.1 T9SS type A sorting domain-containing protein [Bacteroidia bacterium]